MGADEKIARLLQCYETALNTSSVEKIMALFASDIVYMPEHSPASVGAQAVQGAYNCLFLSMTFGVEIHVEEIMQMAPDWVFVRTSSSGYVISLATGRRAANVGQELFILKRSDDGDWKIARFCFSKANSPAFE